MPAQRSEPEYPAQDTLLLHGHGAVLQRSATDAANIVAQMDDVLRGREAAETVVGQTADDIFGRMSGFMETPAVV
jgi:hypothetical protein